MDKTVDRISGLPSFIIHHIMSYLSAKEVAQTSILSKRWNQLRISFPIFYFDQFDFLTEYESRRITSASASEEYRWLLCDRLKEFMEFVDASLLRFCKLKFSMHKLRLSISIVDVEESASYIDKWIGLATEKEVKEIDLQFLAGFYTRYTLPQTIFYARSVAILKLVNCKLENNSDILRFSSLRKLSLQNVFINKEMAQKLSSECPLLEEMCILDCWGLKQICVSNALKLKIISIRSVELVSVEVVAPNLQEFVLESLDDLITSQVIDIIGCSQLKTLNFVGVGIGLTDEELHHFISSFPLLEDLILEYCHAIERIKISSNQLKKFQVSCCSNMKALDLNTPNLLSFTYVNSPIPTSFINALCPWQVKFDIHKFDTEWCLHLRKFLGVSNQIEALTLCVCSTVSSLKLEEFRKSFPSPPCNVGNLEFSTCVPSSEYRILLDALFWICYPRTFSLETFPCWVQPQLFESFYNELKNKDVSYCNSHDIKCWRHDLKDIKVKSFQNHKDRKLVSADNLMKLMSRDNLSDLLSILPSGIITFKLDWCFQVSIQKS